MLESYFKHEEERKHMGIPPLPLTPEQVQKICSILENPPQGKEDYFLGLLKNRVSPGVDPAAKVKAEWLFRVA